MLNLIRMNLYRFVKSKFVVGLVIVAVCSAIFSAGMVDVEDNSNNAAIVEELGVDSEENTFGVVVPLVTEPTVTMVLEEILHSGLFLGVISVFAVLFSAGEKNSGFLKNIILLKKTKGQLFLAKIVPISIFTVLCFLVGGSSAILAAGTIEWAVTKEFFIMLMIQLLLHIAFGIGALAYMEVFRNQAIGLIAAIACSMGFHTLLVSLFEAILTSMQIPETILCGKNMIYAITSVLSASMPTVFLTCTISAISGILLYGIMGSVIFTKRDL